MIFALMAVLAYSAQPERGTSRASFEAMVGWSRSFAHAAERSQTHVVILAHRNERAPCQIVYDLGWLAHVPQEGEPSMKAVLEEGPFGVFRPGPGLLRPRRPVLA
jgi:hypothetical protein